LQYAHEKQTANDEHSFELTSLPFVRPGLPYVVRINGEQRYNPDLEAEIGELLQTVQPDLIVLMLEGGESARSGFQWPAVPFDFCLPGEPYRPVPGPGDIVPYDLLREFARAKYRLTSEFLARIGRSRQVPWISIAPPPVVGDDEFLTRMLLKNELIRDEVRASGLPPAIWRRKMRTVLISAMREMYESHGAPFMDAPAGTYDKDGFLLPEFYHDAMHANRHYGALISRQIDGALVTHGETVG
jgi:hypothetical protein